MTNFPEPTVPLYSDEIDRRWRKSLMAFFLKRVRDRSEAEDLTQETFTRSLQRVSSVEDTNIRSYLFTVGSNLLRDRARRATTHHLHAHDSLGSLDHNSVLVAAEDRDPEQVLIAKEKLRQVLDALAELDERTCDIFIMFRMEKMKQRDIAVLFGISVSAVEKRIVKAVTHLATRLRTHS